MNINQILWDELRQVLKINHCEILQIVVGKDYIGLLLKDIEGPKAVFDYLCREKLALTEPIIEVDLKRHSDGTHTTVHNTRLKFEHPTAHRNRCDSSILYG